MSYPTKIIVRKAKGEFRVSAQYRTNQGKAYRRAAFRSKDKAALRTDLDAYLEAIENNE